MGLFTSARHKHLPGFKELTKDGEIVNLANSVNKVYFPTLSPNGKPINYIIHENDHVKVGTLIGNRTDFEVPIYSSVSGTVLANEVLYNPQIGRNIPYVTILSDNLFERDTLLPIVSLQSSKEEIFEAIKKAGVIGMGGAGFPTYVKYQNTKGVDTLLINGVECEPFLTTDYVTMSTYPTLLLKGIELLLKVSEAKEAIIVIKVHKEKVKDAIEKELPNYKNIRIVEVEDLYPMGWERALIKRVLNREYDRLPIEASCIVNNAQTTIALAKTLLTGKTLATKLITVSGDGINKNANVLVRIGTLTTDIVNLLGGFVEGDINLIPGGPMCSKAVNTTNFPILMQMDALTILKFKQRVASPCLRCGNCTMHCPASLQPVELKIAYERKDIEKMEKLKIMSCVECGMCSYVCPSSIEVIDTIKKAKMIYKLKHK